jgi:hypothetical protein
MSDVCTNHFLDQYEQAVDGIVARCNGDLRDALRALMLVNEQLQQKLLLMSADLVEHLSEQHPPKRVVH